MSDLISREKIRDYIKVEVNPYGKPFEGTAYELGLKIMRYIDAMDSAYSVDKVVEELDKASYLVPPKNKGYYADNAINLEDAIEIVKQGGVSDDVCEWRLCDEEANVYYTSCRNPHILIEGTPKENNYEYCPYCGKKIKVVE